MPPQESLTPSVAPPPAGQTSAAHVEPPQPGRKKLLYIGLAVALVVLAAAAFWLLKRPDAAKVQKADTKASTALVNTLASKPLTDADVAGLDKTAAFFGYVVTAAQQKQVVLTTEQADGDSPTTLSPRRSTYKVGFDYQTKQSVYAQDDAFSGQLSQERCFDGQDASRLSAMLDWRIKPIVPDNPCNVGQLQDYYVSDSFIPGGLTADQAQKYTAYLQKQAGLISVKAVQLSTHAGKPYLHFTVDLTPIKSGASPSSGSDYFGLQYLLWAFKTTGLDPAKQPFAYRGAGGQGLHMEYYIDPAAKLPAYAEMHTTPLKDSKGQDESYDGYSQTRLRYQFGTATFDASTQNSAALTLDW